MASGEWTAVVEYTEQRPELSKALTKREAVLRSTAATFQVRLLWSLSKHQPAWEAVQVLATHCNGWYVASPAALGVPILKKQHTRYSREIT